MRTPASGHASPDRTNSSTMRACSGASSTTRSWSGWVMKWCCLFAAENAGNLTAKPAEKSFNRARGALFQGAAMDRTQRRRYRVPFLEELGIDRAALDRHEVRHAAQFFAVDSWRHRELTRRQL